MEKTLKKNTPHAFMVIGASLIAGLTWIGMSHVGRENGQPTVLFYSAATGNGTGPLHRVGYTNLPIGMYTSDSPTQHLPPLFRSFLDTFAADMNSMEAEEGTHSRQWIILVEEWQANLKRVKLRIISISPDGPVTNETTIFIHKRHAPSTRLGSSDE